MSTEKTAEKMDVLFGKVYIPVFMQKLAEKGVAVKSEADLEGALKIAAMTRNAQQPVVEEKSVIKEAAARLEALASGQNVAGSFLKDPEVIAALS